MTGLEYCSHEVDKVICNFLDYKLIEIETPVLCKDLKFTIPPKKLQYAVFTLPFELLFCDIKSKDLPMPQTKAVKSDILDIAFSPFNSLISTK